jgi:hypothetical protein
MRPIANEDDLQEIKARRRGFLVNVWVNEVVVVHNLEHLCLQAQKQLKYKAYSPGYFAETRQEINNRPYPWGQEELSDCLGCKKAMRRKR